MNAHKKHRWYQFSLRTFLVGSTLAALGIWWGTSWYRRTDHVEVKLGSGLTMWFESQKEYSMDGNLGPVGHGRFRITDAQGRVWGKGQFDQGKGVGRWTWYRKHGRTALTGNSENDCRTARWQAWHANGQLASDTPHATPCELRSLWELCLMASMTVGTKVEPAVTRQGWSTLWHANGHQRAEGAYENDVRTGSWTFWDEQGRKTAEGSYREGLRHGKWTFFEAAGDARETYFVNGLKVDDLPSRIARFVAATRSPDWITRVEAVEALGEIGGEAASELIVILHSGEQELVLRALRSLARIPAEASAAEGDVRQLADAADPITRREALLTLLVLDEAAFDNTLSRLLLEAAQLRGTELAELHRRMAGTGRPLLAGVDRALDHSDPQVPSAAAELLAYLAWPRPANSDSPRGWSHTSHQPAGYRAELQRVLVRAQRHANPAIAERAEKALEHLKQVEK